jgi:hypothetical protein
MEDRGGIKETWKKNRVGAGSICPERRFSTLTRRMSILKRPKKAAVERVRKYDTDPLLLAWYEKKTGKVSPGESCEEEGGQPGWVNYAKSHGGNLTVNVNHGAYIFIFKSEHEFPA